ncbi:grpE protein homolog, mitochondrial [Schistocerca americana]|uniref:grpE protein homolog, mitochondrial n=1 Tax=Schistocerca americana TaxID=7009 RepID=UPI001F4FE51A|nr:grpE protein homolog, mitochondrial [Schistocerca americana]XP_049955954.1 grpE protein homolog, mitochondrial [Schistocerca serialis cubense]
MAAAGLRMGLRVACGFTESINGQATVVTSRFSHLKYVPRNRQQWKTCSTAAYEGKKTDPDPTPPGTDTTSNNLKSEIEKLSKEVSRLTEENKTLDDKYKRALADGENLRRRMMKQIEDAKLFGIQSFCKDLLEVADVLGKATESVPKEEIKDTNPHLKSLYEGLKMTEVQLHKVFKRHGLEPINPLNEKFDPNLHEALFEQEVEGKEAGTVIVVTNTGYKLHERVIRPAVVGVAKAK